MGKKKRLVLMALALFGAVALCSCGGSNKETQGEAGTAGPETAAEGTKEAGDTAGTEASGKGTSAAAGGDSQGIVFTDMSGREIRLDEAVTKVVALTASDCEILYAIGAGDALVGRGEYCDWPEEVNQVPAVQSGADTNVEQIIALGPQVLLMSQMAQTDEQVAALESAGIQVVVSDAQDIEGVYTAIEMIGLLMGKSQEAEEVIGGMKSTFAEIGEKARAAGQGGKKVYFEVSPLQYGLWASGDKTFMNEVANILGVENIFNDVEGWVEVSEEQVIERAPDYIVTTTVDYDLDDGITPIDEITQRAGWDSIPAVAEKRILLLSDNELSRPGPRLADGAELMYDFIYGE